MKIVLLYNYTYYNAINIISKYYKYNVSTVCQHSDFQKRRWRNKRPKLKIYRKDVLDKLFTIPEHLLFFTFHIFNAT